MAVVAALISVTSVTTGAGRAGGRGSSVSYELTAEDVILSAASPLGGHKSSLA